VSSPNKKRPGFYHIGMLLIGVARGDV